MNRPNWSNRIKNKTKILGKKQTKDFSLETKGYLLKKIKFFCLESGKAGSWLCENPCVNIYKTFI
jgi:hypothetical protein